jgi:hypothetical protein
MIRNTANPKKQQEYYQANHNPTKKCSNRIPLILTLKKLFVRLICALKNKNNKKIIINSIITNLEIVAQDIVFQFP